MASLLLIGGSGFFGKSFLDSFQRGILNKWGVERIIVMSRHASELRDFAPRLIDGCVELINGDIGAIDALPVADYVIHAAASTDLKNYLSKPETERINIQAGVYNYSNLAPKFHRNSKIVYVSSGAVYGVQPLDIPFLKEGMQTISLDEMPEGKKDYAIAKRDAEKIIKDLCRQNNLNGSIARCFAFVGPWLPRNQHFAIGNFLEDGLKGRKIKVNADHPVYRSYMYADDLVVWLMTLAENADSNCEAYNVGSDEEVTLGALAKLVANELSVEVSIPTQNNQIIDRYIPSIEKAKLCLGLKLTFDLADGVRATIANINK